MEIFQIEITVVGMVYNMFITHKVQIMVSEHLGIYYNVLCLHNSVTKKMLFSKPCVILVLCTIID